MRRNLIRATLVAALTVTASSAALAQTDAYGRSIYPERNYNSYNSYNSGPYVPPYAQPYQPPAYGQPYEQRAQRGGLRVLEAWYGRERRVCDASHAMRSACDGRPGCEVKAGNELCGDPLPGVVKGLRVTYRCHGQTRHVDQRESGYVGLRCD
jgi:hypothetical protein